MLSKVHSFIPPERLLMAKHWVTQASWNRYDLHLQPRGEGLAYQLAEEMEASGTLMRDSSGKGHGDAEPGSPALFESPPWETPFSI